MSAKACQEPPLLLAASALFALQAAAAAAATTTFSTPAALVPCTDAGASGADSGADAASGCGDAAGGAGARGAGRVVYRPLLAPATVQAVKAACGVTPLAQVLHRVAG